MTAVPTPKDRFTSVDTLAVVRELRPAAGARVDKAFDLVGGGYALALRSRGRARSDLVLVPGLYAALVERGPAHAEGLTPFAQELRRLLTGAALGEVAEPKGERSLEIAFSRSDQPEPMLLVLELFGQGNLLVVRDQRIVAVAQTRRFAHRSVRVGAEFRRPPSRLDPWTLGPDGFAAELAASRTDLTSTLAARLALGGPIAEELVARVDAEGSSPASRDASDVGRRVRAAIQELLREIGPTPQGYLVRQQGAVVDATPYRSQRWEGVDGAEPELRPTFSSAAFEFFSTLVPRERSPESIAAEKALRELERLAERQRAAVESLAREAAERREQAETIFAHYDLASAEIEHRAPTAKRHERADVLLGSRTVPLFLDRSPRESAQELYVEAKRLESKLSGAQAALAETERRRAEGTTVPAPPSSRTGPSAEPRRAAFWFERHRWFVSSEGAVVVAGRDASSNDTLVRRHLRPGDRYVHADVHGAASVIVKNPAAGEPPIGEQTLREAGQFAVAFSKAWRVGLASASAFWVEHDQVSKHATSGEFVAKGAWVVRGSKHLLDDLPTEVGLGTIEYHGSTLWTAAPPSAVRSRGTLRFLVTPGPERERSEREVELARELGISRERLQSLLPAGGITVRRA